MWRCDDRQCAVEIALDHLVEVIAVEMREEHEVERRETHPACQTRMIGC